MSVLGLDLGTSGLRGLLVGDDGTPIGAATHPCNVQSPTPGWSEQDPAEWITALTAVIAELRAKHPAFSDLKGIGVAGHMHGATLLDRRGNVLRPCILWNDTRSHRQAARLDASPGVRQISGNIVFPGFTAPKLEWVRAHEPQVYDQVAKVLLPAAFLNFYLTGDAVADMSDSAGTSWLDVGARDWSDHLLRAGHMQPGQMPRLVEGCAAAGTLKDELQRAWGLSQPVTIAGGAGDNAAAACGIGALAEGQGFVSIGTSGVVLLARDGYSPSPDRAVHTFCHAVPDRWYQMGVMLSATDSLNWLSAIVGQTPAELTSALGDTLRPPGAVQFLPYLSGERTPHNDAHIRGSFTGLDRATDRTDLTHAVLMGVAFGLRQGLEAMTQTGATPQTLFAIGGGSASAYWLKLIATVLNRPLARPLGSEFGAALGAARLAQCAAFKIPPEQVMTAPDIAEIIEPDPDQTKAYDQAYDQFKALYPAIKSATAD